MSRVLRHRSLGVMTAALMYTALALGPLAALKLIMAFGAG